MLKYFRINIIVRVLIMLFLSAGIVMAVNSKLLLPSVFGFFLLSISVTNFIRYVNQTNRDLANFFASIKYDDYITHTSVNKKGENFEALYQGFDLVNQKFRDIRAEKEANHQFLQTLVKHIDTGILCVNEEGEVILMNPALQSLLHKSYLVKLEGLKKIDEKLWELVQSIKPGNRELIKLSIQNELVQLSIRAVDIKMQNEPYRLISFQNIQNELEAQELIAWQKLIRILTHEIMNSVAPISSLSSTMNDILDQNNEVNSHELAHVHKALKVIQKRSEALLSFTETYRRLTRIPPPSFQLVDAKALVEEVITLLEADLEQQHISLEKRFFSENLTFTGDPHLLEQVLINLVKNAIDALEANEKGTIQISVSRNNQSKIVLQISDDGPGIPEDKMEQIFVPFFTTKEKGSGIGLSLSRQIIRMHKGNLDIQSEVGKGTVVSLTL